MSMLLKFYPELRDDVVEVEPGGVFRRPPTAWEQVKRWWARVRPRVARWLRSAWCLVVNWRHELYVVRGDKARGAVYQRCLLCDHETRGWAVERRGGRVVSGPFKAK